MIPIIQSSQFQFEPPYEEPVIWNAPVSGDYPVLTGVSQSIVTMSTPPGANDKAFNHHPHVIELDGVIHAMYSTANTDEEEPGQYVRYQQSLDFGLTWSSPVVLLESQDDITKGWTTGGRVCIPAGWAIVDGNLYACNDINDRGASGGARTGVGILASKVSKLGAIGNPVWIKNVDGTTTAPTPVVGYPSYLFNTTLSAKIINYFSLPGNRPTWWFSTPTSDPLRSRILFGADECSEPSDVRLPSGKYLSLWRLLAPGADVKIGRMSIDGQNWGDTFETEIPDHPSRTEMVLLSTGNIGITGNGDNTNRTPLFFAQSKTGLKYETNNVWNVDTQTVAPTYPGVFKDTGVQYPDILMMSNGRVMIIYSDNKEDMKVSTFDVPPIN